MWRSAKKKLLGARLELDVVLNDEGGSRDVEEEKMRERVGRMKG